MPMRSKVLIAIGLMLLCVAISPTMTFALLTLLLLASLNGLLAIFVMLAAVSMSGGFRRDRF